MYTKQTMVQFVARTAHHTWSVANAKNILLVSLAKSVASKTDALFTGAIGLQRLHLMSPGVFSEQSQ